MTNNRSTNEEKELRINEAADELAKGKRAMDVSKKLAKKYSVSIQQAREYVRLAKPVLTESISPNDRAYIFSKVMSCLEQDRLDARKDENLKEQTKSTGGMVKMVSLLTSIDQVGSWDSARESEGDYLFRNFSEIARKKKKYADLDSLDNTTDSETPF